MNTTALLANWKSTVSGILTVTLSTSAALLTYPPVMAHAKWVVILGGVQIVGKIWIALIQQDAGTVSAVTREGIQNVPSHEVPNDPKAIPIVNP